MQRYLNKKIQRKLAFAVNTSIQVLPGDSFPPSVSRKAEGSNFAFSISEKAERTSLAGTFLVFAAFLSTFTDSSANSCATIETCKLLSKLKYRKKID